MREDAPHHPLYTRLKTSPGRGIGVFAIRAIPQAMNPFAGDAASTVRVPVAQVQAIEEAEVRQIYFDFCPVVDEAFIAPANLNLLTVSWYMNHSDQPNVAVDGTIMFAAKRAIEVGEELTVDYRQFSDWAWQRHSEGRSLFDDEEGPAAPLDGSTVRLSRK